MSYKFQTTFWQDFSIADAFGNDAIKDTYKRSFREWKNNLIYITELVIVLNWKCWYYYEHNNNEYMELYRELYYRTHDWCLDNLKSDDLKYYLNQVDLR